MVGLPTICMAGTLTADPELRFTPAGLAVCNFTVACNPRTLNRQTGQWEDGEATFLRCTVWRTVAENVGNSLRRGQRVIVSGSLKQRNYEHEGQKRTTFDVDVDEIGASLKWANVEVRKIARTDGPTDPGAWGTPPAPAAVPAGVGTGNSGFADEPPF
jgi:single-strand DNA-binding protein